MLLNCYFFEALTKLGIETRTKDLQIFAGGAKKGDWDVGISQLQLIEKRHITINSS